MRGRGYIGGVLALSIAFFASPSRGNPHHELFGILTSTLPNFFLLLKNEPPPPAFFHVRLSVRLVPAHSSNTSTLPLVVASVFPLERRPMVPPSPANFYFPASGVLKITLRPCLRPLALDKSWWWWRRILFGGGTSLWVKGWFPLPGCTRLKKAQKGKECQYEREKCGRHKRRETKIARAPRKDPMSPSVRSFLFPPPLRFSLRRGLYQQKNVMYCFSRSFPNVVFEFVFPAKFPAYKLLPPLCLISTPSSCTPSLEYRATASLSFSLGSTTPYIGERFTVVRFS